MRQTRSQSDTAVVAHSNLSMLESTFARLKKEAEKIGMAAPSFEITSENLGDPDKFGMVEKYYAVRLINPEPIKVEGFAVIGNISHLPTDKDGEEVGIYTTTPGNTIPEKFRGRKNCDHCGYHRRRNETYILKAVEGKKIGEKYYRKGSHIQVGTGCLSKFLDGLSVRRILREVSQYDEALDVLERASGTAGNRQLYSLKYYLGHVAAVIRVDGWVSRSDAFNNRGTIATADRARDSAYILSIHTNYTVADEDIAVAEKAVAWANRLKGENSYEKNITAISHAVAFEPKQIGIAASIVGSYLRASEKRGQGYQNAWYGTLGQIEEIFAKFEMSFETRNHRWGHIFRTTGGAQINCLARSE